MEPDEDQPTPNLRAYRAAVTSFVVAMVGGVVAVVGYWTHASNRQLGVGLAMALGGIGFGLVSWAKFLDLDEHAVQEREPLRLDPDEVAELDEITAVTKATVTRRPLLLSLIGAAFAALAAGFVGPLGSLGPSPKGERNRTSWTPGERLVTADGQPIRASEQRFGQLATVFPAGATEADDSQVVLLRVQAERLTPRTSDRAVEGWVAYSKICTHAGCSVGLLGIDDRGPETVLQLVCPCHQSIFDPLDAAQPVGGPATRRLPQLPIAVDAEGFLVATGDFDRPVGPPAWDEA